MTPGQQIVEELRRQRDAIPSTVAGTSWIDDDSGTHDVTLDGSFDLDSVGKALLRDRPPEWRCFHCDEVFTDRRCAALHFGADEDCAPACQIKGAEGGLVKALRDTEEALFKATSALHAESADALRAWREVGGRHHAALIAMEQTGYERGLADMRHQVEVLSRALIWHGDPARLATTREDWQQTVDEAVRFVRDNPEEDRRSVPAGVLPMIAGKTYRVSHNPNCPSPYEVRFTLGVIDGLPPADSRDAIGYGNTFEDAVLEGMGALAEQRRATRA